jgi:uncharacterized protein (TIGR04206 family)
MRWRIMLTLPFTTAQFFEVLGRYNIAVWPAQVALFALALASTVAIALRRREARAIGGVLALFWAWMGVAYHFAFFTAINRAAWGFGVLSVLGAAAFAWHAARGTLAFRWPGGARGAAGAVLIGFALVGYPLIGGLLGERYPQVPTFGLPCPTTIFTLGMLLFAVRPVPRLVFLVPLLWSGVGTVAAFALGVRQDLGLLAAAAVALLVLVGTSSAPAPAHAGLREDQEAKS